MPQIGTSKRAYVPALPIYLIEDPPLALKEAHSVPILPSEVEARAGRIIRAKGDSDLS